MVSQVGGDAVGGVGGGYGGAGVDTGIAFIAHGHVGKAGGLVTDKIAEIGIFPSLSAWVKGADADHILIGRRINRLASGFVSGRRHDCQAFGRRL